MLKVLVRVAGVAIAALVALLAGVYAAAADLDGLPDADHVASLRFDDSPLARAEIIDRLDAYADSSGVGIIRVASAPDDFLNERLAFTFGSNSGGAAREIEWFSPTMKGSLEGSADLGFTGLNGVYALYATDAQASAFESWAKRELGAEAAVSAKSPQTLLTYALLTVGAWVPSAAALLLLCATILSWYTLRARARELSMLAGMRLSLIVLTDLRSLFAALALPAAATVVAALAVVLIGGYGRVGFYLATVGVFLGFLAAVALAAALLMAVLTLPDVRRIAARKPPEGASWALGEVLKAISVVLVAAIVPGSIALITAASTATELGATWASLGDGVTVRIGSAELGAEENAAFGGLAGAAARDGTLLFSMSLSSDSVNLVDATSAAALDGLGYDSVVIANREYLSAIGSTAAIEAVPGGLATLPSSVTGLLLPTLQLWTDLGETPELRLYRSTADIPFPVFGAMAGTFDTNQRPLILVVDDADQLNDEFLSSAVSRGNAVFEDPDWVATQVEARGMSDDVLSIDRVADLGLYDAQSKQRNAQLAGLAVALAVLALLMSLAVTAWILALLRRRRWFVQRTAGRSWPAILLPRMLWESAVAVVFGAALASAFLALAPGSVGLAPLAAVGYLAISWFTHLWAGTATFRSTLDRRG